MKNQNITCSVVIVTHNSEVHIPELMKALQKQSRPADRIVVVDSGSKSTSMLASYAEQGLIELIKEKENVGFCKGNNIGASKVLHSSDYLLFLNPDAFLKADFIEKAIELMQSAQHQNVGIATGLLLGYDIQKNCSTGKLDSTGVFQKWYGKWYDRGQSEVYNPQEFTKKEELPAICGALMFCRVTALKQAVIKKNQLFDEAFYMWKEDIDLSLRTKKLGWRLLLFPSLISYHCRGWNSNRAKIPKKNKLMAARNEIRLHLRHRSPHIGFSCCKYLLVSLFNY